MKVAIIGSGPSAAFALLACSSFGIVPTMYLKNSVTFQPGAFFIHELPFIPAYEVIRYPVSIMSLGTRQEYIDKQWKNHEIDRFYQSSFPEKDFVQYGYNPNHVIPLIFSMCDHNEVQLESLMIDVEIQSLGKKYDVVFISFLTQALIQANRNNIIRFPVLSKPSDSLFNFVMYNGIRSSTVRLSDLWGTRYIELTADANIEEYGSGWEVHHSIDIVPRTTEFELPSLGNNIIPIGRLARFNRTLLSHQTYEFVREKINELLTSQLT